MFGTKSTPRRIAVAVLLLLPGRGQAQAHQHGTGSDSTVHDMWSARLGRLTLIGMGQVIPMLTSVAPATDGSPLRRSRAWLTQPVLMGNLDASGSRIVLRTTLDFEGLTIPDGELTPGAWGEGFIDARHPHTLLHEAMLSINAWNPGGIAASLSFGKGFAPFGTDDPMMRPGAKYPTNHHLSQILERWTLIGVVARRGWSLEAGWFGGDEPDGPWDLSNIGSFGDSWSGRLTHRWNRRAMAADGASEMAMSAPPGSGWEASVSAARVAGRGHAASTASDASRDESSSTLVNASIRFERRTPAGSLYALAEASRTWTDRRDPLYSVLGETRLVIGRHEPYARFEWATRPEFARHGAEGDEFVRYDHDSAPVGSTRWRIATVAWAYRLTGSAAGIRPFVEVQHHASSRGRGDIDPATLFGVRDFFAISLGTRIYAGGGPMRMGAYGVLDGITAMRRGMGAGG